MLAALACVLSGCIVWSIYPWLPDDTKVADISLVGTWYDAKEKGTAFFTAGKETNYNVLFVSNGVERIYHRAGTPPRPNRIASRLRPCEEFVQRLLGSKEETGKDEFFSVSTSP